MFSFRRFQLKKNDLRRDYLIDDVKINFCRNIPQTYIDESFDLRKKTNILKEKIFPENYQFVKVFVKARSIYEASNQALDALDLFRGILNLFINMHHGWRISFGVKAKPVNNIVIGPIHTLHYPHGKLASKDVWWYETSYIEPISSFDLEKYQENFFTFYKDFSGRLKSIPYSSIIKNSILRYTRALDEVNFYNAFMKVWGILELLTGWDSNNYDVMIDRLLFLFKDREHEKQIIRFLRFYRNSLIHEDSANEEIEAILYFAKNFAEQLILFHVFKKFDFDNIQDAVKFLDLPKTKDDLTKEINERKYALKFLRFK